MPTRLLAPELDLDDVDAELSPHERDLEGRQSDPHLLPLRAQRQQPRDLELQELLQLLDLRVV